MTTVLCWAAFTFALLSDANKSTSVTILCFWAFVASVLA